MIQLFGRIARPFFVLLAIFTVARWLLSTVFAVPYERGTWLFSIVLLTIMASLFSTAYTRRWLGWGLGRAALFAMFLAFTAQLVILLSTAASYALGLSTYFNYPTALNQPQAVGIGPGPRHPPRRPRGQHADQRHRGLARVGDRGPPPDPSRARRPPLTPLGRARPGRPPKARRTQGLSGVLYLDAPKLPLLRFRRSGVSVAPGARQMRPTHGGRSMGLTGSFARQRLGRPIRSWSKVR